MNKFSSLIVITLLLASSLARSEEDNTDDFRYCLELKSNYEIAKCAGEISAGSKGRPYSKEEVDKILSEQQTAEPSSQNESSETPETGNNVRDLLLEQDEGGGN